MNLKVGTVDRGLVYKSSIAFLCQNFAFLLVVAHVGVQPHTQLGPSSNGVDVFLIAKLQRPESWPAARRAPCVREMSPVQPHFSNRAVDTLTLRCAHARTNVYRESRTMKEKHEADNISPYKKPRKANCMTNKEIWILLESATAVRALLMKKGH